MSNSVIEHVGGPSERARMASEILRMKTEYFVQTPSKAFPIEAHSGMPFWWFYPESTRKWLMNRWRNTLPEWVEMVEQTSVLSREELQRLFPDSEIHTERVAMIPKSITAVGR